MIAMKSNLLFGASLCWNASDWTASDDRVRGGKSESHLDPRSCPRPANSTALFYGNLDITTLGGAGFASQRTATENFVWDLSTYAGIRLDLGNSDEKMYTFILKDEIPETYLDERTGTEREQSSVSWEYDFRVSSEPLARGNSVQQKDALEGGREDCQDDGVMKSIFIPWKDFKPTYRGREKKDATPLDLKAIRRMSLMMRSFFGTQQGPFHLTLRSISAIAADELEESEEDSSDQPSAGGEESGGGTSSGAGVREDRHRRDKSEELVSGSDSDADSDADPGLDKGRGEIQARQGWLQWLWRGCGKL